MAVRPGEENVATLFGDIHYFYGPDSVRPRHHRFDKGSYVYLFENAASRTSRIEIANQPGTDDQDAFEGFLDHTLVRYSYKQQCLVSITVDGVPGAPPPDHSQWHLPTFDPSNQAKYHYKLHSLDIYFWTQNDALQFVNGVRRLLPPHQVEVADEPGPPAHFPFVQAAPAAAPGGSLVQKLENMAVSDPQYAGSGAAATPDTAGSQRQQQQQQQQQAAPPPVFVPMAYNPAAPAAPEQIAHREKTPPPPDDGLDPLAVALARDQHPAGMVPGAGPFGGPHTFSAPPGQIGLPGPPGVPPPPAAAVAHQQQQYGGGMASSGFAPSPFGHLQRAATMPVSNPAAHGLASPGLQSPYGSGFPQQQQATPPPPPPPAAQNAAATPHAPPGGFAQYSYEQQTSQYHQQQQQQQQAQAQQQQAAAAAEAAAAARYGPTGGDWSVHQQVYRPTEQEYINHKIDSGSYKQHQSKLPGPAADGSAAGGSGGKEEKTSKLGQNAERLENGLTGMLKKFEKKFI